MATVLPTILPSRGVARVKNVLSGDTVVLLGKATTPNGKAPEVTFTMESVSAPRMASKNNSNIDEPGAFPAREWLRQLVVGKMISFETRKQGASAGDRVYGLLLFNYPGVAEPINLAVEAVRNGFATPKNTGSPDDDIASMEDDYKKRLALAYEEAKKAQVGVHGDSPLVRKLKNAGDEFQTLSLIQNSQKFGNHGRIKCVIEYIFDGSRYRLQVTDPAMGDLQYAGFTLFLGGVSCPRLGNTRASPPTPPEEFAEAAKQFVELRLLQRELEITLHGTDKSGVTAVGTVHHPKGNIAVELLKNGLAKMSDWSVRMMSPLDVPALRIAERNAKLTNSGVWHSYSPPQLAGASHISGTVVEVLTGDTVNILPDGVAYDSESKMLKVSLASIRAPRLGNERVGRPDERYCHECKDRLRVLTVGKQCQVQVHYERDIQIGDKAETRQFGTLAVKNKPDVGEVLITEGLATTQYHKDGEETSPRYDDLRAAEALAKATKKGLHSDGEYKRDTVNDLGDPKKAKAYSGALMRAGTMKAIVDYCFNGARFKMLVPSENCYITFAPNFLRCPQPSPMPGSRQTKAAEPFGDISKRHARLTVLQRTVEITVANVTMGGVFTGSMVVGQGAQRRDYSLELVGGGLATVDQRKIDYGEVPKQLVDAQSAAQQNRVGIWSIDRPSTAATPVNGSHKVAEKVASVRVSEIRSATHFFYHVANDEAVKVINDSMKVFTTKNGTAGAPCDVKVNRPVAALFDDGTGKSWYRAKVLEKLGPNQVKIVFIDHGNVATVPITSHLRPLDPSLSPDRIPPVAQEACLALTVARPLSDDYGIEAARLFQSLCWGKDLTVRIYGTDDSGKIATSIVTDSGETVNEKLVSSGLARVVTKRGAAEIMANRMVDGTNVLKLAGDLEAAQEVARRGHYGMWRYGDVGDDDDEMILHVIFRGIFKPTTLVLGLSLFLTFKRVCLTMDFSSPTRALQSLQRRRPSVSEETLQSLRQLLTNDTSSGDYLEGVSTLLHKESARWECLAVGLLLATQILVDEAASQIDKAVYIDGPRVPEQKIDDTLTASYRTFSSDQLSKVATWLHEASLQYLEHNEPRVRTFVAKAVGAHATWSVSLKEGDNVDLHAAERNRVHSQIIRSIDEHIREGRDNPEKYSKSSTGALDDTTGWRALETNWQCLACWIASLGSNYFQVDGLDLDPLLKNLEYSAVTHVNRHVRAAAIAVLEQLTISAGNNEKHWPLLENGSLREANVTVLKAGLADNWSQVRMAASVLNRVFWKTLKEECQFQTENLQQLYPVLIPRMCLNRFYLAQGVKLYSHQTWKLVFPEGGVEVVAQTIAPIVRYYVKMCDADNHVVREGACQAVAELAVKIGMDETYADALQPHVTVLLQALLMCFHDESWPVRDEACLACGTFCRAYPEECRPELATLWERWTEQLTDQIWSVRADAAVALGQACQAYGDEFLQKLLDLINETLPSAQNQPKMTLEEYKALQNDMASHTDSQLYSCGSLAPKLKKKAGAGRIGCSSCDVTRAKQPWEATDGCVYLIRELVEGLSQGDSILPPLSDDLLLPLFRQVADVCRVSHFPQSDDLRATLWRQLPAMMYAVGKQRCKRLYLELFMDLMMRNLESRTASAISKHAAASCAYELSAFIGPNIFRGRIYDDYQREAFDRAMMERQIEEQQMSPMMQQMQHQTQFSPFEPPGLLDNLDNPFSNKMTPGLPPDMLNQHPGIGNSSAF